jgi:hypothetical protein
MSASLSLSPEERAPILSAAHTARLTMACWFESFEQCDFVSKVYNELVNQEPLSALRRNSVMSQHSLYRRVFDSAPVHRGL